MPAVFINGVELHYEDTGGTGFPVVFSHGLLWSGRMFDAQVAHLRSSFRCIAYDHRGQGRSASSPKPYDMDQLTDDAGALMAHLGIGSCHFVGLSMGGFVGLRLALRRPELLRSLTLVESAADAEPRINIPKYKAMALFSTFFGYKLLLPSVLKIMFGKSFLTDPARAALRHAQEEQLLTLKPPRVALALSAVTGRGAVEDQLGRITTPTQVIHGSDDAAIIPARARSTASAIPGARWVEIPRAGHTSTVEEPDAVNAALSAFFASI